MVLAMMCDGHRSGAKTMWPSDDKCSVQRDGRVLRPAFESQAASAPITPVVCPPRPGLHACPPLAPHDLYTHARLVRTSLSKITVAW